MLEFVDVKEDYKQQLRKEILEYYYDNLQDDTLYEHLHDMDLEVFAAVDKAKTVELLVREGMCKEAFLLVSRTKRKIIIPILQQGMSRFLMIMRLRGMDS